MKPFSDDWSPTLLNLQVLALTLIPLLCPVVPGDGADYMDPLTLLGIEESVDRPFLLGTWKCTKHFVKWGRLDRKRAKVTEYSGRSYMSLYEDGSVRMLNLFQPERGKWDLTEDGIVLYDPARPDRVSKLIPVHKRSKDFVWLILPFAGGANGIGMVRVSAEDYEDAERRMDNRPAARVHSERSSPSARSGEASSGYGERILDEGDSFHGDPGL